MTKEKEEMVKKLAEQNIENVEIELNCEKCGGLCCMNPPQISNIKELEFALNKNVEIAIVKNAYESKSLVFVKEKDNQCPFLDKDNYNCSIYEDRFNVCKEYKCKALMSENGKIDLASLLTLDFIETEEDIERIFKNLINLSEEQIASYQDNENIEILNVEKMLGMKNSYVFDDIKKQVEFTVEKNYKADK